MNLFSKFGRFFSNLVRYDVPAVAPIVAIASEIAPNDAAARDAASIVADVEGPKS